MTKPGSEEYERLKRLEGEGYEEAKKVRREILLESNKKAARLMKRLAGKASKQTFTEIPELLIQPQRGIETSSIADRLAVLYAELNAQATLLVEWREQVVQLLLRPLVDEDEDAETTGEELMDSAKFQDLLMVYYYALRAAIADRQDAITGQTNELVKHETETSIRIAKEGEGPAPEKLLELLEKRKKMKPKSRHLSLRGAISELRSLQSQLGRGSSGSARQAAESQIAAIQLQATQTQLHAHGKIAMSLESEIESFKVAMNTRLEYYRQLQAVSDAALPYEGAKSEAVIARVVQTEEDLRRKLSTAEAKYRYLLHLRETGSKSNEPRMCVICQLTFTTGVLTACGHQFCKECMSLWFEAHQNCPVCKRSLKVSNLHDITIKPQQLQMKSEELHATSAKDLRRCSPTLRASSGTKQTAIYKAFSAEKLAEIKNVELEGPSFTTKVDTLVRHLMWLREADPGAKSIVFSQFTEFLTVLRTAFRRYRIGHASINDADGITKFKEDPAVEVFLLHARAHASGLNLVNASHVFLCEPLLNTALELQAIARVDRIGQLHETIVWLYVVNGTVEESIHNLSIGRRTEHMSRNSGTGARTTTGPEAESSTPGLLDAHIEEANTLELEHSALSKLMSKDKSAGEVVDKGDLWECLFGHVANNPDADAPSADASLLREKAVMSYMAGEAAARRQKESPS